MKPLRLPLFLIPALFLALPGLSLADEPDCLVFHDLVVHSPSGPQAGWSVVVQGDRIAAAGSPLRQLSVDGTGASWKGSSCTLVATPEGAMLTAGLVQVGTRLGLVEVSLEGRTRRHDAEGDPVRADHRVADSFDPQSSLIPIARLGGITAAVIEPTGGMVSGQSAWVELAGDTQAEAVVDWSVAMPTSLSSSSPAAGIGALAELLDDARVYARDRRAYDQNRSRALAGSRRDLEALQPVLEGEVPLVIRADRAALIEALLRFAREEDIRLVLRGGAEAWIHAEALAEAGVAVVVDPMVYGPGGFSQLRGRADNPAILAAAGVRVIITHNFQSSHSARNLRHMAGNAVRDGMPHAEALRAITETPGLVFGQGGASGRIESGARANVVLWSGDPLEISSRPLTILIGGEAQSLETRQTLLRERYRTLPGTPTPPPSAPAP